MVRALLKNDCAIVFACTSNLTQRPCLFFDMRLLGGLQFSSLKERILKITIRIAQVDKRRE